MNKNIRFWEFVNDSHVKITLRPGQELNWNRRGWNGEGYSQRCETWLYESDEKLLINKYCDSGRDCDGYHKSGGELYVRIDELKAKTSYSNPNIKTPNWKKEGEWQRDLSAELAGY